MQRLALPLAFLLVFCAPAAWTCDLCAVYAASEAQGQAPGWHAVLSEQFTRYDKLQDQGHRIADDGGQYLNSSVTQLVLGYGFSDRWSAQVGVPLIARRFRRPAGTSSQSGSQDGLGDVNLTAQFAAVRLQAERSTLLLKLLAGVKLPTGDSDRLREELSEDEAAPAPIASGIHGHDLALGSGSTDLLFGASALVRVQRWLGSAQVQYAWRRRGDFHYRYGDDLQWSLAGGRYLKLSDEASFALQLIAEGEDKKFDDLAGRRLGDTRCGVVLLGPQLALTSGSHLWLDVRALLPVQSFNSQIQAMPAYRLRLAAGYRF